MDEAVIGEPPYAPPAGHALTRRDDWLDWSRGPIPVVVNAIEPTIIQHPYEWYRRLRVEAPLCYSEEFEAYLVTRYDDVRRVIGNAAEFSNVILDTSLIPNIFNTDDDDHQRYRRAVMSHFNPRFMMNLADEVRHHAVDLARRLIDTDGDIDLVGDFAYKLPIGVIADVLGVPASDGASIASWADAIVEAVSSGLGYSTERRSEAAVELAEMGLYFSALIEHRRKRPGDDLISQLVHHESDQVDSYEMLLLVFTLMLTGHVTTVNMLSYGLLLGLEHPDKWAVTARSGGWLGYVEETLRYEAPLQVTVRRTRQPVTIQGHNVAAGELIYACMGSANRDPDVFESADAFEPQRLNNRHLAFGAGPHLCLATVLARLEGQAAFAAMAEVLPRLRLAPNGQYVRDRPGAHGLERLIVQRRPLAASAPDSVRLGKVRLAAKQAKRGATIAMALANDFGPMPRRNRPVGQSVAEELARQRGVMLKIGQMLSFVDVPGTDNLRDTLERVRGAAAPMPYDRVEAIIRSEIGPIAEIFGTFERQPRAAASIGQVHFATTPDGAPVAVKVQYPGIEEAIRADCGNADLISRFLWTVGKMLGFASAAKDLEPVIAEVRERVLEEVDYGREAQDQEAFGRMFAHDDSIHIPSVERGLCSPHVLTTSWVDGIEWKEALGARQELRDRWGETIFRFSFTSLYRYGFFNADPHPGNYIFLPDGTVTFIDFGCVKRCRSADVGVVADLIWGVVRQDTAEIRRSLAHFGITDPATSAPGGELREWFDLAYEPLLHDEPIRCDTEFAAAVVDRYTEMLRNAATSKKAVVLPTELVMLTRIQLGIHSILGALNARSNWRQAFAQVTPGRRRA